MDTNENDKLELGKSEIPQTVSDPSAKPDGENGTAPEASGAFHDAMSDKEPIKEAVESDPNPMQEIPDRKICVKQPKKKISVSLGALIVAVLLTGLLVFQATFISLSLNYKNEMNQSKGILSSFPKLSTVIDLFSKKYLHNMDLAKLDETLTQMFIYASGDEYAAYYTPEMWENEEADATGNSKGIGVYILPTDDDNIEIVHVMTGSGAEAAGLLAGDIIIGVSGYKVAEYGYNESIALISGTKGSFVTLEILRDGKPMIVQVERIGYETQTVISELVEKDGETFAYIRIIEFMRITPDQFKFAVNKAIRDGAKGFLFDVRDNPGGETDAVCNVLDFLLPYGPIIHILDSNGNETEVINSDASSIDMPMVVLTNSRSASSAEIFASALRDYDKATLVGTRTYGKGCGQMGYRLADGSVIYITGFYYSPPFSENYDGVGVEPNIHSELPRGLANKNLFLIKKSEDTQFITALSALADQLK